MERERRLCEEFVGCLITEATNIAAELAKEGVPCLFDTRVQEAFTKEWLIARLCWLQHKANDLPGDRSRTFREVAGEVIGALVEPEGQTNGFLYFPLVLSFEAGEKSRRGMPMAPGPFIASGFRDRVRRIAAKTDQSPPRVPTSEELGMVFLYGDTYCWRMHHSLKAELEHLERQLMGRSV